MITINNLILQVHNLLDSAHYYKVGFQLLFRGSVLTVYTRIGIHYIYIGSTDSFKLCLVADKATRESYKSYHECSYQYLCMA